jgi:hypothetical protein
MPGGFLHVRRAGRGARRPVVQGGRAFFDRRWPVRRLLQHVGSKGFAELKAAGMNGMYLTDQAVHQTALMVSALLITLLD